MEHHAEKECLWARAIIPMGVGGREPQEFIRAETLRQKETYNFEHVAITSVTNATDGAGGPAYIPHEIRKVGSAVSYVNVVTSDAGTRVTDIALKISEVPGKQTVPRAETWAGIMAYKASEPVRVVRKTETKSDSLYFVRGFQKADRTCLINGTNGDLWNEFPNTEPSMHVITKVKAHAEKQVLTGNMG